MKQVLSYYQRNKDRIKAKARQSTLSTSNGIRLRGLRKRPYTSYCELCRSTRNIKKGLLRLVYHHWFELRPDLGLWLCMKCHTLAEMLDKPNALIIVNMYYTIKTEAGANFDSSLRRK